jgi:diguanylate cyclase (GGDEF)-like protein
MRIGTRMTAGFVSMAVLLAATGGLGWILASQQISGARSERLALVVTRDIQQYQLDVSEVAVAENSIAFDFASHSNPSIDFTSFDQSERAALQDGLALGPMITDAAERAELVQANHGLDAFLAVSERINAEFLAASPSSHRAAIAGVAALDNQTTGPLGQLELLNTARASAALAATSARNLRERLIVAALDVVALALAAAVGGVVTRSITSRLRRTAQVLEEVAAGDLTRRIEVDSTDEVGQMASALNLALDHIEVRARALAFESRLANALEMAGVEPEVLSVVEQSFSSILPGSPTELLLADNSHAHLLRKASASPTKRPPGCPVDSPDHCPAARRGQVQRFSDSEALDACPKLRGRAGGALSAICVPVSIMGRAVGVIHATGDQHHSIPDDTVRDLEMLAKLAGSRIGLLRVMSETQLQATTDSLTGLMNRRSFEESASALRRRESHIAVAMADLDHFKVLNDTYGHETGDRALRLFARALSEGVRDGDLACRHGGEEFVIMMPRCTTEKMREILDTLRVNLDAAITVAGLPKFTVSFGVVEADYQEDLPSVLKRADAALYQAKSCGRDQVIVQNGSGEVVLTGTESTSARGILTVGG